MGYYADVPRHLWDDPEVAALRGFSGTKSKIYISNNPDDIRSQKVKALLQSKNVSTKREKKTGYNQAMLDYSKQEIAKAQAKKAALKAPKSYGGKSGLQSDISRIEQGKMSAQSGFVVLNNKELATGKAARNLEIARQKENEQSQMALAGRLNTIRSSGGGTFKGSGTGISIATFQSVAPTKSRQDIFTSDVKAPKKEPLGQSFLPPKKSAFEADVERVEKRQAAFGARVQKVQGDVSAGLYWLDQKTGGKLAIKNPKVRDFAVKGIAGVATFPMALGEGVSIAGDKVYTTVKHRKEIKKGAIRAESKRTITSKEYKSTFDPKTTEGKLTYAFALTGGFGMGKGVAAKGAAAPKLSAKSITGATSKSMRAKEVVHTTHLGSKTGKSGGTSRAGALKRDTHTFIESDLRVGGPKVDVMIGGSKGAKFTQVTVGKKSTMQISKGRKTSVISSKPIGKNTISTTKTSIFGKIGKVKTLKPRTSKTKTPVYKPIKSETNLIGTKKGHLQQGNKMIEVRTDIYSQRNVMAAKTGLFKKSLIEDRAIIKHTQIGKTKATQNIKVKGIKGTDLKTGRSQTKILSHKGESPRLEFGKLRKPQDMTNIRSISTIKGKEAILFDKHTGSRIIKDTAHKYKTGSSRRIIKTESIFKRGKGKTTAKSKPTKSTYSKTEMRDIIGKIEKQQQPVSGSVGKSVLRQKPKSVVKIGGKLKGRAPRTTKSKGSFGRVMPKTRVAASFFGTVAAIGATKSVSGSKIGGSQKVTGLTTSLSRSQSKVKTPGGVMKTVSNIRMAPNIPRSTSGILSGSKSKTRIGIMPALNFGSITSPKVKQKQSPRQKITPSIIPSPISDGDFSIITGPPQKKTNTPIGGPPPPPTVFGWTWGKGKKSKSLTGKAKGTAFNPAYMPSIEAMAFGIKGTKPGKTSIASGIGLRPMLSKVTKRRKKRK